MKQSAEDDEYGTNNYRAYLIRMWRSGATQPWHVSLESTKDRERLGFPNLAAAFTFLYDPPGAVEATSFSGDKTDASKSAQQGNRKVPELKLSQ